ncbi:hypothetical protein ACFFKU_00775 [Kineococcus gynurae]|uniref:Uncharacterized protein n=1 Tax=Kineococcus gynurae TaxID=452979 RepID=A0ABV5LPQ7_9ACTN
MIAPGNASGQLDRAVLVVLTDALQRFGPEAAVVESGPVPRTGLWVTRVAPRRDGAARLSVAGECPQDAQGPDVALNITISNSWLEVAGLSQPFVWLRALADAVFAGRVVERGFPSARAVEIETACGTVIGGAVQLPLLGRLFPQRRFLPYDAERHGA